MMNRELIAVIEQIGREKRIDTEKVVQAIEAALQTAANKRFGGLDNIQVRLDRKTGEIEAVALKTIVETVADPQREVSLADAQRLDEGAELGDEIGQLLAVEDLGRIAAQTAKQVIFQRVREAEMESVYQEFHGREREIVSGVVLGQERRNYIIDLGKTEAVLPIQEQVPRENFRRGDRIRALLVEVRSAAKGHQLILSRSHPEFVSKLFALEVPEIGEGIVQIKHVVREGGDRTKIAVISKNTSVDPVGACVGVKGSRVQAVVRELRGEKIDIIPWSDDARIFIGEALSPAVVEKVGINEVEHSAIVVVADQQLSLAIGKKGQNVRLAAKLTGWKIDILSEGEYDKERAQTRDREITAAIAREHEQQALQQAQLQGRTAESGPAIEALPGVGPKLAALLQSAGFDTLEKIVQAAPDALTAVPMVGEKVALKLVEAAKAALADSSSEAGQPQFGAEPDPATGADTGSGHHNDTDAAPAAKESSGQTA
jgi:transcription termination/antitermination protein NusA